MDILQYINSGIIEGYVLGIATREEMAEVDNLRMQYPQVEQAIEDFSLSLESRAIAHAVPPPAAVKEKIFRVLSGDFKVAAIPLTVAVNNTAEQQTASSSKTFNWRFAAAASIILFVASTLLNIYLYNRYTSASSQYQALLLEKSSLQANSNFYQTESKKWRNAAEMLADPEMAVIKMPGVSGKNENFATLLWDTRTKDVYVMPNKLPSHSPNQQYQLWAIINGKPVDAGMLDPDCESVCKMKNIRSAQAFAITLEKKGGSPAPEGQMFVMGNVGTPS